MTPVKFAIAFTLQHLKQAGALVHVYNDASAQVNHGGTEMGQGLHIKVAQVVAERLGIGVRRVKITAAATDKVPNTAATAGTPNLSWDRASKPGKPFVYFACGAACSRSARRHLYRGDACHPDRDTPQPGPLSQSARRYRSDSGFVQGMGWLTTEEFDYHEHRLLMTHSPSRYKMPACSDVPDDFRVELWGYKGNRERTIYRSKAVGEPPLMLAVSVFSPLPHAIARSNPGVVPRHPAPATPKPS